MSPHGGSRGITKHHDSSTIPGDCGSRSDDDGDLAELTYGEKPHTKAHTAKRLDRTRGDGATVVELGALRGLVVRAHRALLGLVFVSEGKAQNIGGEVVHGGDPDYTPRGDRSLHDYHRGRIQRARGTEALRAAVCAAEEALSIARGGEARHRSTRRWELFVVERYEGWTTADVGDAERCKRMEVWRAREKHKRNGRDGSPRQAAVAA